MVLLQCLGLWNTNLWGMKVATRKLSKRIGGLLWSQHFQQAEDFESLYKTWWEGPSKHMLNREFSRVWWNSNKEWSKKVGSTGLERSFQLPNLWFECIQFFFEFQIERWCRAYSSWQLEEAGKTTNAGLVISNGRCFPNPSQIWLVLGPNLLPSFASLVGQNYGRNRR